MPASFFLGGRVFPALIVAGPLLLFLLCASVSVRAVVAGPPEDVYPERCAIVSAAGAATPGRCSPEREKHRQGMNMCSDRNATLHTPDRSPTENGLSIAVSLSIYIPEYIILYMWGVG